MTIVPPPTRSPHCPLCDAPSRGFAIPQSDGTTQGNYLCADGHLWVAKWLTTEGAA